MSLLCPFLPGAPKFKVTKQPFATPGSASPPGSTISRGTALRNSTGALLSQCPPRLFLQSNPRLVQHHHLFTISCGHWCYKTWHCTSFRCYQSKHSQSPTPSLPSAAPPELPPLGGSKPPIPGPTITWWHTIASFWFTP